MFEAEQLRLRRLEDMAKANAVQGRAGEVITVFSPKGGVGCTTIASNLAIALAEGGARVHVVATGFATTHWAAGGFDAGVVRGAATPQAAVDRLARKIGHPYRLVAAALPAALEWVRGILAEEGLTIVGGLSDPLRAIPTALGSTRIAAVLPDGMAAALAPWEPGETLVVCGPAGFRDFWPHAIVASLRRPGSSPTRPSRRHPSLLAIVARESCGPSPLYA